MDAFLAHLAVHDRPGGERSWLVIALVTSAIYALALTRWLRLRQVEAMRDAPGHLAAPVPAGR